MSGSPDIRIIESESPCGDLPAIAEEADLLIVVDSARTGKAAAPGAWSRIDYRCAPDRIVARPQSLDVHSLGVDAALSLAMELGVLPSAVWVYAVAVADCGYGEDLTPAVRMAVDELAQRIPADIAAWREGEDIGRA